MFQEFKGKERKIAIALLENARKRIQRRYSPAVCLAITASVDKVAPAGKQADHYIVASKLRRVIMRTIGFGYVTQWLSRTHNIYATDEQARHYRMFWIDSMINQLKEKK